MAENQEPDISELLSADNHDRLLRFQADDETLAETVDRLLGLIPHSSDFEKAGINPKAVDDETRVVIERWPTDDNLVEGRVYESPMAVGKKFLKAGTGYYPDEAREKDENST